MPLPQRLARFNRAVTNHISRPIAERLPGFGVVTHRGRRTGRSYRTPVNAFRRQGGFVFALTYGEGDWVKNVIAAGEAELLTRGRSHRVTSPRVVIDPSRAAVPRPVGLVLRILRVDHFLLVDQHPE